MQIGRKLGDFVFPKFSANVFTVSENVDIRDAEHGFSSVFFSCTRISALCEWRPETEPEAIT